MLKKIVGKVLCKYFDRHDYHMECNDIISNEKIEPYRFKTTFFYMEKCSHCPRRRWTKHAAILVTLANMREDFDREHFGNNA